VDSTLRPPLAPMLARLERELPSDGYLYEPKWDGFRGLAFCVGKEVDLRSRNQRPLARYFPELVASSVSTATAMSSRRSSSSSSRFPRRDASLCLG
jgi:ATP-dependent DNA ligase